MNRTYKTLLSTFALVALILAVAVTGALAQLPVEPGGSQPVELVSPDGANPGQPPGQHRVEFLSDCGQGEICRDTPIPVQEDQNGEGLSTTTPAQALGRYRVEFLNDCSEGEICRDRPIPVQGTPSGDGLGSALQTSTITIVKNADPADGIDFTFNSNLGTFPLDDAVPDDSDAVPDSRVFEVAPSVDWSFIEQAPPGWDLTSIGCSYSDVATLVDAIVDGGSLVGVTIRPALEDDVTCTFNNQLPSSSTITIAKNAQPADGTDFTFNGDRGTFALDDAVPDDSDAVLDSIVFEVTPSTDWSFTEQAPLFWDLTSIVCTYSDVATLVDAIRDGGSLVGATIRPAPEDDVTCTFYNQKVAVYSTYLPIASKNDLSP